jgi:protoheme IX farnesyltransferase
MLPVVAGRAATTRQILVYSGLLVLASELPWVLGFAGAIYGMIVATCGGLFLLLAVQLNKSGADRLAAHRLFLVSISYLFVLFAALLIDHGGGSFPRTPAPHAGRSGGRVHAEALPSAALDASSLITLSTHEV